MAAKKGKRNNKKTRGNQGEKPRLLLLSESLPVRQMDGGNIRIHHFLRSLGRRYRVTFVGFTRDKGELKLASSLKEHCDRVYAFHLPAWRVIWNCIWGVLTLTPLNVCAYRHGGVGKLLKRLRRGDYQLVYVYRLRMAHYVLGWPVRKVLDLTDCLSEYYRQRRTWAGWHKWLYWRLEELKMRRYEPMVAARFSLCLVVTGLEKARLNQLNNVRAVGNGVDLRYFKPDDKAERQGLVFTGTMSYQPNADAVKYFVRELLPAIRRELPGIDLTVVGRKPPWSLKRRRWQGVRFTGEVEDIRPFLRRARVFVNPLRLGVGLQNKLLQAMACGAPVVTTPFAARALGAADGHQLLVGRGDEEFVSRVVRVCRLPKVASQLSRSGRRFVENRYSWEEKFRQLEAAIENL